MAGLGGFRSLTPARQVALAAAGVILIAAILSAVYVVLLDRPYAVLFSDLRPADAATITADLDKKKVPYRLEDGGATIKVPKDLVDRTRLDIASEDLPTKGTVGFELFNKSDMGLTDFAQRINYQRALQGELARTIMAMDTIDSARVHLTLAEPTVFRDDRRPSKAAVTVWARPGKVISASTIDGIRRLVAAATPDLAVADVVVLDAGGAAVGGESMAATPAATPEGQLRGAIEDFYAARAREAIVPIYPGDVDIQVVARSKLLATIGDGGGQKFDGWTPAARAFPLTVVLSYPSPPALEVQDKVKRAVGVAVGLDAAGGDILTVVQGSESAPDLAPAPLVSSQSAWVAPRPMTQAAAFWQAWLVPVLIILLVVAVFVLPRLRPRGLSDQRRRAMANRLKDLLEQGEAHAASSR